VTDFEWRVIEPLLLNKPQGVRRVDDRRVLNGTSECYAPARHGAICPSAMARTTCYKRFVRWRKAGVWDRLMDAVTAAYDGNIQMIDSNSVRAHRQAATAKKAVQISVSVDHAAGSRPRSTSSSIRRACRFGAA